MHSEIPTWSGNVSVHAAVVMADISGSTPLYEREGNAAAAAAINARIARMREAVGDYQGTFVSAKGDDVLCWFQDAHNAVDAAYAMAAMQDAAGLTVHAGAQWGPFVHHGGDIFGTCVNEAARLCSLAKSGEIVMGDDLYQALPPEGRKGLVEMSSVRLKGLGTEMRIFSRQVEKPGGSQTVIFELDPDLVQRATPSVDALFEFNGQEWRLDASRGLKLGRMHTNDMAINVPTVSREHGTISFHNGLVEYADHSSAGSYIQIGGNEEFSVFRRSVVINGEGSISLGGPHSSGEHPKIRFRVALGQT